MERALANLRHLYANMTNGAVRDTASAKRIAEGLLSPAIQEIERTLGTFEAISDPKNAHIFSKEAAYEAFKDVGGGSA